MSIYVTVYKDKERECEEGFFRFENGVYPKVIDKAVEKYNPTEEACVDKFKGECNYCECATDTRYKITHETGFEQIDKVVKEHGFAWVDIS